MHKHIFNRRKRLDAFIFICTYKDVCVREGQEEGERVRVVKVKVKKKKKK